MATLSSSNSILTLSVAGLFPVPVPIQGFATDDAFSVDEVQGAETMMGIDGKLSAGYTPYSVPLNIHLQADSASNIIFDTWIGAERISKDKFIASCILLVQGTGALYTFTRGFLKSFPPITDGKKVLQPRKFVIEFESVTKGPF